MTLPKSERQRPGVLLYPESRNVDQIESTEEG